jgi:hypothetical protein
MFPSISYYLDLFLLRSRRRYTTLKIHHLNPHASTHEGSVEYHPTVSTMPPQQVSPKLLHSERGCHLSRRTSQLHQFTQVLNFFFL